MALTKADLKPGHRVRIIKEPIRTGTVVSQEEFHQHWGRDYFISPNTVGVRWDNHSDQRCITQLLPRRLQRFVQMKICGNELVLEEID